MRTIYNHRKVTAIQHEIDRCPELLFTVIYHPECSPPPISGAVELTSELVARGDVMVIEDLRMKPALQLALGLDPLAID